MEQKQLVAFYGCSPRLHRTVVLCITGILLALSIGLSQFQGQEIALQTRIVRRSESSPIDSFFDQNSNYTSLIKRVFDEAAWDKALNTYGKPAIICNLPARNPSKKGYPKQSEFLSLDDLGRNGWTATRPDSLALATAFDGNIVDALTKLGALGPLEETPEGYYSNQNQDFRLEVDGILTNFDATYGHYASSIDVNTGLFVAEDNYSPKEMIKNNGGKYRAGQMPPSLDNWADVTYLQWLQAATDLGGKPRDINARLPNLKYFARFHIINTESQGIINHALKNVGEQLGPWPGRSFSMRTDEGKAILGSPNGRGVAFFLYQHKDLLGIKTVGSVTVFSTTGKDPKGNDETWYQAVFILRNL